ncbi:MAG TPA: histidine kinase, partial [Pseudomonadales bacterium]|nr:histidine kinase [Pseudomonadales bacterium]
MFTIPLLNQVISQLLHNRNYQFWLLQLVGWSGHSIISFFSLNLWYNDPSFIYIAHNIFQSVLGALLSWPLRWIYTEAWKNSIVWRSLQALLMILIVSLVWSAIRIETFIMMTGEMGLWSEFGGWYFSSIFVFAAWTSLYFGIKYFNLFQEEHSELLKLELARKEEGRLLMEAESVAQTAKLKMLRYQLNPHFLFNTLNAIMSLVASEENDKASAMLVKLSQFMRYSLDKDHEHLVDLQDELDAIGLYLKIEEVRFQDRLNVVFDIEDRLERAQIPGLLLQPLVENAIKYAIAPSEEGGEILITAKSDNGRLCLSVKDSAEQLATSKNNPSQSQKGFGVGLTNTRQRLATIFANDYSLDVAVGVTGSGCVSISMPLI